jgi:hypothetical protein
MQSRSSIKGFTYPHTHKRSCRFTRLLLFTRSMMYIEDVQQGLPIRSTHALGRTGRVCTLSMLKYIPHYSYAYASCAVGSCVCSPSARWRSGENRSMGERGRQREPEKRNENFADLGFRFWAAATRLTVEGESSRIGRHFTVLDGWMAG